MAELLEVILRTPGNFFGTIALILVTGIAIAVALSPFNHPRDVNIIGDISDDEEDDVYEVKED